MIETTCWGPSCITNMQVMMGDFGPHFCGLACKLEYQELNPDGDMYGYFDTLALRPQIWKNYDSWEANDSFVDAGISTPL